MAEPCAFPQFAAQNVACAAALGHCSMGSDIGTALADNLQIYSDT